MDKAWVLIELLPQQLINGLTIGSVYALIALGYTMVYGVLQLINFAHGDLFMLGAMIAVFVLAGMAVTEPLSLALAIPLLVGSSSCAWPWSRLWASHRAGRVPAAPHARVGCPRSSARSACRCSSRMPP